MWAQLSASQRNAPEAERIVALAGSRGNAFPEIDRARLQVVAAGLRGDARESARALETLNRLAPGDPALVRQLAATYQNAHQYAEAIRAYQQLATLQPDDPLVLNSLGYAQLYAGDLAGSVETFKRYAQLRTADPNALDSLGDASYAFGRFAEAEKYYKEAGAKDPNFINGGSLVKAAYARLVSGDLAGADAIFEEFAKAPARANDPMLESRRAEWEYSSGRRKRAVQRMEAFAAAIAPKSADVAVRAYCQVAVWNLLLGDRKRARDMAMKATAGAGPASLGMVALVRFLTDQEGPVSELPQRADRMFPNPNAAPLKKLALAYAYLLARDYGRAMPLLQELYDRSAPSPDGGQPVLLAWALVETGHYAEAEKLLARVPVPNTLASDLFGALYFPRYFFLKGEVLRQPAQREEAAHNYRLFFQLAGPGAEIFGHEQRARQALGTPTG
jgi:tetratricopeptide (TPR) repeat protein